MAWVAGPPDDSQQLGFSDDGEPAGTAGKPMLAQLMGSGVGEITAVVVRYYGGILLGTGGLVKAYGGGVQQALKQLALAQKVPEAEYILQCDYAQLALVENLLQQTAGRILQGEYGAAVVLHLALPATEVELFQQNWLILVVVRCNCCRLKNNPHLTFEYQRKRQRCIFVP